MKLVSGSARYRQMLGYTKAGDGERLAMLLLHDDARREYAYGPARGLPDTKVDTFTQALYEEAKSKGWTVICMRNDWKSIFAFEQQPRERFESASCITVKNASLHLLS